MASKKKEEVCFENSWYLDFSILRNLHDDETLVEVKKKFDADGDDLGIFITDSTDAAPRCEVEVLEDFCRGTSLEDVESGNGAAGHRRAAWLDDRTSSPDLQSGDRPYKNPLTATGLKRALEVPRYNHEHLPDAARRLIYITDLDPACIHALAATASCHQTTVLRNAIYKHLAFQTSIAVKIPSAGFLTFQLDLHLPFFILRKSAPPEEFVGKVNKKPWRRWTDMSFLKIGTSESQDQKPKEVWGIREVQTTCVVAGSDDWRWVGYGFVDAQIDDSLTDLSEVELSFDRIAAGELEANIPIWRPRDYWLKLFEIRIEQVRKEWEYLIHKLELSVNQYMNEHPFTLSRRSRIAGERAAEMKEAFDWTLQTMGLLRRLDGVLSNTVEAWEWFNSPGEDIGYFRDTDRAAISPNARRSLHAIKAIFRQLQGDQKKMVLLNKCCSDFSRAVSRNALPFAHGGLMTREQVALTIEMQLELRLSLESKETADYNGATSEFTVSVLYPVALTAIIFNMQREAIPFHLNGRPFALAAFILIAMVYAIRLVIRHGLSCWPSLRKTITLWIKTIEMEFRSYARPTRDTHTHSLRALGAGKLLPLPSYGQPSPSGIPSDSGCISTTTIQLGGSVDNVTDAVGPVVLVAPPTKQLYIDSKIPPRDIESSTYLLELKHWKHLIEYLVSEFDRHSPIDDIVVLISNGTNAWCTTCRGYVEWRWGSFGYGVMNFLNFLLAQKNSFHNLSSISGPKEIHKMEYDGQETLLRQHNLVVNGADPISNQSLNAASISIDGSKEAAQKAAEIIGWIFSALIILLTEDKLVAGDDSVIVQVDAETIYSVSSPVRQSEPLSESACWHALFPYKVVALGTIPERPPGMNGLEIDFRLLVQLSGVDVPVLEEDGLYLDGCNTALYPISYCSDMRCLQWHLVCRPENEVSSDDSDIHSNTEFPTPKQLQWYKTRKLSDLESAERHFLGWCRFAIVTLGTNLQDYTEVTWSAADAKGKSIIESSTNLTLNLSFHGIGAAAGKTFKRGRHERNAYENHEINFLTSIMNAKKNQILLYCPSKLQAWLVPKVSVLLHLVLAWMADMAKGDPALQLPMHYAAKTYDGGENAYQVLKSHGTDPLPFGDQANPCCLVNIVRMFLFAMNKLQRHSAVTDHTISGWEMYDLVDPPEYFAMKVGKFRRRDLTGLGGWKHLLPKVPLVLFYEGLEDPIIADSHPCRNWDRMPTGRNLLGVTSMTLKDFTRRFQSRYLEGSGQLTDKCYWHCPYQLFEECRLHGCDTCNRVQMIYLHDRCSPPTVDMLELGAEGAIVFESGSLSWHSIMNLKGPEAAARHIDQRQQPGRVPVRIWDPVRPPGPYSGV